MFPKENKCKSSPTASNTELGNTKFLEDPKSPSHKKRYCFHVPAPTSSDVTSSSVPAAPWDGAKSILQLKGTPPPRAAGTRGLSPPGHPRQPQPSGTKGTVLILCSDVPPLHSSPGGSAQFFKKRRQFPWRFARSLPIGWLGGGTRASCPVPSPRHQHSLLLPTPLEQRGHQDLPSQAADRSSQHHSQSSKVSRNLKKNQTFSPQMPTPVLALGT